MGGSGSGRPSGDGRITVEECLTLDVNKLFSDPRLKAGIRAQGQLCWTTNFPGKVTPSLNFDINTLDPSYLSICLSYIMLPQKEEIHLDIRLETTRPYFGGLRWWFCCPLIRRDGNPCDRRVVKLRLPPGGKYYGCRECYDLTYTSCLESHQFDGLYARIAGDIGLTPSRVKRILNQGI